MINRDLPAMDSTRCKKGRRLSFAKLTMGVFFALSSVSLHGSVVKDLMEAAYAGDAPLVNSLLEKGPDINYQGKNGRTPLFMASGQGHEAVVQALLAKGAETDLQDDHGATPLFFASQQGHEAVVQALLDNGAEIDRKEKNGATALMMASLHGHEAVVQTLVARGADIKHEDNNGVTALMRASYTGHHEIVNTLLAKGAEVDRKNKTSSTALMMASQQGHEAVVQALLAKGAEIKHQVDGFTALMFAANKGHEGTVRALLDNGAEIDRKEKKGWTALMMASSQRHEAVVQTLVARGADIEHEDNNGVTALMRASYTGQHEIVNTLLANGAEADHKAKDGSTALVYAFNKGHREIVIALLANGAEAGQVLTYKSRAATAWAWESLFGDGKKTTKMYAGKSQPDAGLSQILVLPGLSITAVDGDSVKSKRTRLGFRAYKQLPGTYVFEVTSWKRQVAGWPSAHKLIMKQKGEDHATYTLQAVLEAGQKYVLSPIWNDGEVGIIAPSQVCLQGQPDSARYCALRPPAGDDMFTMDEKHGVIVVGLTGGSTTTTIMINLDCEWRSYDNVPVLHGGKAATKLRDVCQFDFKRTDSKGYIVESVDAGVWMWWGAPLSRLLATITFDVEPGKVNYVGHVGATYSEKGKLLGFTVVDHFSLLEPILRAGFGDSEIVNKATHY